MKKQPKTEYERGKMRGAVMAVIGSMAGIVIAAIVQYLAGWLV
jgi:hypothetical protein